MGNLGKTIFWLSVVALAVACLGESYHVRYSAEKNFWTEASIARAEALRIQQDVVHFTERAVPSGLHFAAFLQGFGIDPPTATRLMASAQPVFDLRHLRAGNQLSIGRSVLGD